MFIFVISLCQMRLVCQENTTKGMVAQCGYWWPCQEHGGSGEGFVRGAGMHRIGLPALGWCVCHLAGFSAGIYLYDWKQIPVLVWNLL
jgi:hypothetical protein